MKNIFSAIKLSLLTGLFLFNVHSFAFAQVVALDDGTAPDITNSAGATRNAKEDAIVTNTIKKLIKESKNLSKLNVNVTTDKGVVRITGNVDSNTQASSLIELAESVVGVSDVDASRLTVKNSEQPLSDAIITAKIKGLFVREKLFGEKDIAAINTSVETKDGVVYLSGVVDNQEQIDNAIAIIKKSLPQVKKIEYSVKKRVIPVD